MPGDFGPAQAALAPCRIVDGQRARIDGCHNHEVIEVPMHNRGEAKLVEVFQLDFDRSRFQAELIGHRHEVGQGRALQRHRVLPPQRRQVDPMAVERGHHRQAGKPALRGLGLQYQGSAPASGEFNRSSIDGSSYAPRQAEQRIEHPLDQPPVIEQHIGVEQHAGLQGDQLVIGVDALRRQRDSDAVGGLLQRHRQRRVAGIDERLRDLLDPAQINGRTLVRKRLVTQARPSARPR